MNIALFLNPDILVESGGYYIFEREVLHALILYAENCGHTFYIFGTASKILIVEDLPPHVKFVQKVHDSGRNLNLLNFLKKLYLSVASKDPGQFLKKAITQLARFFLQVESKTLDSLTEHRIDLIWFLGPYCPTMELPYILTVWDLGHLTIPYFPEVSVRGRWDHREELFSKAIKRAAYIIAGTQAGKSEIENFYRVPSERLKIIPFAVPSFETYTYISSSDEILRKYRLKKNYLFYPAQFWPLKNHASLLKAVHLLKRRFDLPFDVVFTGADRGNLDHVKQLVSELKLSQHVHFLGFVPREDMAALYRGAFALTYATFLGPDNLPPLEAFALGCPVIASKVSGAMEQLGDAAILFDPKQPEDIALSIKSLYDDPALREDLIRQGLARAASWSMKDYVTEMISVLDEFSTIRDCWSSQELYKGS